MKDIEPEFKREGWKYTLVDRCGTVAAMYRMEVNGIVRYEVWRLRTYTKDDPKFGIKAGDVRKPSTSEWGTFGWTFIYPSEAANKFWELCSSHV